ncbi:MAG: hypothetical protein ACE5G2_05250, partial [Candidatus Krumholzibacteriia bacterium]
MRSAAQVSDGSSPAAPDKRATPSAARGAARRVGLRGVVAVVLLWSLAAAVAAGAGQPPSTAAAGSVVVLLEGGPHAGPVAVTHAGVGSPPELRDGAQAAAEAALEALLRGASSLEAAIAGT